MWLIILSVVVTLLALLTSIQIVAIHRLVVANAEMCEIIEHQNIIIDSYIEDRRRRGE